MASAAVDGAAVDGATVLYVDADPDVTAQVTDTLSTVGATVHPAGTVDDAIAIIRNGNPDYVVTAHDLPDGDAFDVIDAARAADVKSPPVVFADAEEAGLTAAVFDAGAHFVPNHGTGADRLRRRLEAMATPTPEMSIPETIKKRAMDEAPVGITIADATDPDDSLVYVNQAFEDLTGYPIESVLGRNCRFLQTGCTDPESVKQLREAIDAGEPVSVELRNRRRDGELFWNRVDIAPIHDESGTISHYIGFQTDVTRRRKAEEAARRWAEECRDERRAVEQILNRVEGVIANVSRGLIESNSRRELERRVCDCIAATEGYSGAWIGTVDPPRGVVDSRAHAGELPSDVLVDQFSLANEPDIREAVETGTVRTSADLTPVGSIDTARPDTAMSVAVVPIAYRQTTYGVLLVYAVDNETFNGHDTVVLESIGRQIGAAINAIESKRMTGSDGVVDVEIAVQGDGPLVAFAAASDSTLIYEGINRREDGTLLLFLRTDGSFSSSTMAAAIEEAVATSGTVVRDHPDGSLIEILLPADCPLAEVNDLGVRLTDIEVDPTRAVMQVEAPGEPLARSTVEILENHYEDVDLRGLHRRMNPDQTRQLFVRTVCESLTDRQLTALETAYNAGFFEWPHETSGEDLAATMDVSRSTFHQHLHAAQRKIFDAFFDALSG